MRPYAHLSGPLMFFSVVCLAWGIASGLQGNLLSLEVEATPAIALGLGIVGAVTAVLIAPRQTTK
jgi:xanthosine utilization system XapX-like protein